jgi:hypothetical protein
MKQIGARQEAGRIGGIGACGRELCCASWMSSFSSVTTNAARMQEISLNPQKLAGQCSKLKCCLMYEYDVYADARRTIPRLREPLQTLDGEYYLIKIDPLAGTMSFSTSKGTIANLTTLPISRVREILELNRAGIKAETLVAEGQESVVAEPTYRSEEDSITRFDNKSKRNKRNKRRGAKDGDKSVASAESAELPQKSAEEADANAKTGEGSEERRGERQQRRGGRDRDRRRGRENAGGGDAVQESQPKAEANSAESAERQERPRNHERGRGPRGRRHGHDRRDRAANGESSNQKGNDNKE